MQEEMHINVMPQGEQLSVLKGEVRVPWYANESGLTIESVPMYIAGRTLDPKACYVVADRAAWTVSLYCHEGTPNKVTVAGQLVAHPDLCALNLNSGTQYQSDELMRFLRSRKRLFFDPNAFDTVIRSLTSFRAKITTMTERTDDRQAGKQSQMIDKYLDDVAVVEATFRRIQFNVSLLRGSGPEMVNVEVGLTPTGNGVAMSLECLDLDTMVEDACNARMDAVLKSIEASGIPILAK
jgi:hypothetical protein